MQMGSASQEPRTQRSPVIAHETRRPSDWGEERGSIDPLQVLLDTPQSLT
jgi:hypothetical protein